MWSVAPHLTHLIFNRRYCDTLKVKRLLLYQAITVCCQKKIVNRTQYLHIKKKRNHLLDTPHCRQGKNDSKYALSHFLLEILMEMHEI